MSDDTARPDPTVIGEVAAPPFARLPDPHQIFIDRALRLRALAAGSEIGPYLRFLADLAELQYRIQDDLPEPAMPDEAALARARTHGMPPLDRAGFTPDAAFAATFDRFTVAAAEHRDAPGGSRGAGPGARGRPGARARPWCGRFWPAPFRPMPWPSTSMSRRCCRSSSSGWRRGWMLRRWARSATAPAPAAAGRRSAPWWSAGAACTASASAPAACAAPIGTRSGSNACCAAAARASATRRSKAAPAR